MKELQGTIFTLFRVLLHFKTLSEHKLKLMMSRFRDFPPPVEVLSMADVGYFFGYDSSLECLRFYLFAYFDFLRDVANEVSNALTKFTE